jgi:hypothetical protein
MNMISPGNELYPEGILTHGVYVVSGGNIHIGANLHLCGAVGVGHSWAHWFQGQTTNSQRNPWGRIARLESNVAEEEHAALMKPAMGGTQPKRTWPRIRHPRRSQCIRPNRALGRTGVRILPLANARSSTRKEVISSSRRSNDASSMTSTPPSAGFRAVSWGFGLCVGLLPRCTSADVHVVPPRLPGQLALTSLRHRKRAFRSRGWRKGFVTTLRRTGNSRTMPNNSLSAVEDLTLDLMTRRAERRIFRGPA